MCECVCFDWMRWLYDEGFLLVKCLFGLFWVEVEMWEVCVGVDEVVFMCVVECVIYDVCLFGCVDFVCGWVVCDVECVE